MAQKRAKRHRKQRKARQRGDEILEFTLLPEALTLPREQFATDEEYEGYQVLVAEIRKKHEEHNTAEEG